MDSKTQRNTHVSNIEPTKKKKQPTKQNSLAKRYFSSPFSAFRANDLVFYINLISWISYCKGTVSKASVKYSETTSFFLVHSLVIMNKMLLFILFFFFHFYKTYIIFVGWCFVFCGISLRVVDTRFEFDPEKKNTQRIANDPESIYKIHISRSHSHGHTCVWESQRFWIRQTNRKSHCVCKKITDGCSSFGSANSIIFFFFLF